jgi:predicted nucleotide-binding protein (sugar kinase/HSP70/actin superfamily)
VAAWPKEAGRPPRIGLPAALNLVEDLGFWQTFFGELGLPVAATEQRPSRSGEGKSALEQGKERSGAEFCAPLTAWHGHVLEALGQADFVFAPRHLEKPARPEPPAGGGEDAGPAGRRQYCYATQFAASLAFQLGGGDRVLSPLIDSNYSSFKAVDELHRCLAGQVGLPLSHREVADAWAAAERYRAARQTELRRLFAERPAPGPLDVEIVLIGRPYSVLPPSMNKGIPELIADRGVAAWYQDMLPDHDAAASRIGPLLKEIPWEHGKRVLAAAETAARTPGLYPALITSFKCGPDSYVVDAFKAVLAAYGKPYLVLELDEHDSAVGYETRLEAAIRAFRNHRSETAATEPAVPAANPAAASAPAAAESFARVNPHYAAPLAGRTLLFPCWDELAAPLLCASLRAAGIDARVLEETDDSVRASLSTNNGQCLPMNAIAESFIRTVRKLGLDPAKCSVWMAKSTFACNIPLYPHGMQAIFDAAGGGFERSSVYHGELSFLEISPLAAVDAYLSYLLSGLIRRLACRIRPYELERGRTDAAVAAAMDLLVPAFENRRLNKVKATEKVIALFESIPYDTSVRRPLVGLFGDFYVRDNRVMNQDVIRSIEASGGEVVSMPFNQYAKMIADTYFSRWRKEGNYGAFLGFNVLLAASKQMEKAYCRLFGQVIDQADPAFDDPAAAILGRYGVAVENSGESAENLLKTWYIKKHFPQVALFVQLSPIFCCAGLVTEAMNRRIEAVTGVPVVSLTYDGTGGSKNAALEPYLRYPRRPRGTEAPQAAAV